MKTIILTIVFVVSINAQLLKTYPQVINDSEQAVVNTIDHVDITDSSVVFFIRMYEHMENRRPYIKIWREIYKVENNRIVFDTIISGKYFKEEKIPERNEW